MKNFIFKFLCICLFLQINNIFSQTRTRNYWACCSRQSDVCDIREFETRIQCRASCYGHDQCVLKSVQVPNFQFQSPLFAPMIGRSGMPMEQRVVNVNVAPTR